MKVICAWCGKKLGEKAPINDNSISHGICQECADKQEDKDNNSHVHSVMSPILTEFLSKSRQTFNNLDPEKHNA